MILLQKSRPVKWYIQNNIEKKEFDEFKQAIENNGDICIDFFHIPFDNAHPEIDANYPAVFYCAGEVLDNIYEQGLSGVFYNSKMLNLEELSLSHTDLMWNPPFFSGTFDELKNYLEKSTEDEFFLRPAIDNKKFGGMVITKEAFGKWYQELVEIKEHSDMLSERILASAVNRPQKEYRLLVNEKNIVTGSPYAIDGMKQTHGDIPQAVLDYAQQFIEKIEQPDIFMLDMGVKGNKVGVIEINGIHNAGVYGMSKNDWVKALHHQAEKRYFFPSNQKNDLLAKKRTI